MLTANSKQERKEIAETICPNCKNNNPEKLHQLKDDKIGTFRLYRNYDDTNMKAKIFACGNCGTLFMRISDMRWANNE